MNNSSNQDKIETNGSDNNSLQTLIPTKNMPTLISYYCGVFSLIPFCVLILLFVLILFFDELWLFLALAPFFGLPLSLAAIISGIVGLNRYEMNPTSGAKRRALVGIILGVLQSIVFMVYLIYQTLL